MIWNTKQKDVFIYAATLCTQASCAITTVIQKRKKERGSCLLDVMISAVFNTFVIWSPSRLPLQLLLNDSCQSEVNEVSCCKGSWRIVYPNVWENSQFFKVFWNAVRVRTTQLSGGTSIMRTGSAIKTAFLNWKECPNIVGLFWLVRNLGNLVVHLITWPYDIEFNFLVSLYE